MFGINKLSAVSRLIRAPDSAPKAINTGKFPGNNDRQLLAPVRVRSLLRAVKRHLEVRDA